VSSNNLCLVVEDSDVVRKVMRHVIEGLNFPVEEDVSTADALARCKKQLPAVIVLDWNIPGSQPLEFVSAVRSLPSGRNVKILYVLTNNEPAEISRAITVGVDAYMFKPFVRVTLEAKIAALTTRARDPEDDLDYLQPSLRVALGGR
jgi:two-component system, chemotaxis family, chemotaxis protein CheY